MKHTRALLICTIYTVVLAGGVAAEQGASLFPIPIVGLREEATVRSYDTLDAGSRINLVTETRDSDGLVSFHIFEMVGGELRARVTGRSGLPVRFIEPPVSDPVSRVVPGLGTTDRYWPVPASGSPTMNDQLVTAVRLPDRRFADVSAAGDSELPPVEAGLAIHYVTTDVLGDPREICVLEPNLVRRGERMTPTSAGWVRAQGSPHLLVGMSIDAGDAPWPVFYRLYSPEMELVFQTEPVVFTDPNMFPQPVTADLTGDGEPEIIVISTSAHGPALAVLKPGPAPVDSNRVLALNDCHLRMNGPDVEALQRRLVSLGFGVGRFGVDGWYGPDTRSAVVKFQRDRGLTVSGVVDRATWIALDLE